MKTVRAFLNALQDPHTYDLRTNVHFWFGLLWGLPIPFYLVALTSGAAYIPVVDAPGMRVLFLAHPLLFAAVFGALGTMRMRLEEENRRLIRELREQAWVDPLTGLYNRRYVMEEFRNLLKRAARTGEPARVVLFDLDGFKEVNDKLGHLAGDKVLQKTAAALRGAVREADLLGRFGGDEFLMVAGGDAASVNRVVERCQKAVKDAAGLTISAGVAAVAARGEAPETLIERADADLSASKRTTYETKGLHRRGEPEVRGDGEARGGAPPPRFVAPDASTPA
jgi:diguanylate cyclase (GGDEF)-like protein